MIQKRSVLTSLNYYHPGCEEIPTPSASGCHFHEQRVGDSHEVGDSVVLCVTATNQQKSIVDPGKDKQDN